MSNKDLNEIFNIEQMKNELDEITNNINECNDIEDETAESILRRNIQRAEKLLETIELEVESETSNLTARLMETAARLIDCITTASNSLISNTISLEETNQKAEIIDLKKLEYDLKKQKLLKDIDNKNDNSKVTNNILVTSREELLD
jgi:hypothetical protein